MRMKKAGIILRNKVLTLFLLIVVCDNSFGQNLIDRRYQFEFIGGCDKHIIQRTFLNDSVFVDSATITSLNHKYIIVDTFMRGNNQWHYLLNGEWLPSFSKNEFLKGEKVLFWGEMKSIPATIATPVRQEVIKGRNIFVYRIQSLYDVEAFVTEYYFDFDLGVVKITDTGFQPKCRTKISSLL